MNFQKIRNELPTLTKIAKFANPNISIEDAEILAITEIDELESIISSNEYLLKCSEDSAIRTLRSVIKKGLTVDQTVKLVYILPNYNSYLKTYEVTAPETVDGKLFLAYRSGRIVDHRACEFDGSVFTFSYKLPDNRWQDFTYDWSFFTRLMGFSEKKNKGKINALYGDSIDTIDISFAKAKVIKHSLTKLGINPFQSNVKVNNFTPTGLEDIEDIEGIFDKDLEL
jgi:hypothetical protein